MSKATIAESVCKKLGITIDELNQLYGRGEYGSFVAGDIRRRFSLPGPDETPLDEALLDAGVITPAEAEWLRDE